MSDEQGCTPGCNRFIKDQADEIERLQSALDRYQHTPEAYAVLDGRIRELETENERLRKIKDDDSAEFRRLDKALDELQAERDELREHRDSLIGNLDELRTRLRALIDERDELRGRLEALREPAQQLFNLCANAYLGSVEPESAIDDAWKLAAQISQLANIDSRPTPDSRSRQEPCEHEWNVDGPFGFCKKCGVRDDEQAAEPGQHSRPLSESEDRAMHNALRRSARVVEIHEPVKDIPAPRPECSYCLQPIEEGEMLKHSRGKCVRYTQSERF